ncbi:MAG: DNA polymerase III subunit epsilon [gamma proteobacterium symbiont of Bathyaustriella thionipta]|nr:DNA polymerase III subunit epsilon [gamma proteobacterium symbiont of Bathyaustriella thionipta]MCU7950249.1 DNA polymerase III subunit epsilon [gamma proteobacterium symbiont of Bathyaustriella thionipta]MCU7952027.1 DNA polymerase III subunit epsilon [gamma proteobacterium symbiont of Bathyaustriella thionipta]MCU7957592.1 DNA polymerase III subunit epsilon [gamma proteobacterium symbiont of Bathyaustriella thionipta]MCU7965766.1 DNA polymerase III subunit epsilon [gamma proteobacterium sy
MRQIVLDTETTGLEPSQGHRIIEIGCVELLDRKLTGNTFHHYVNPERIVDEGAIEIHGITNEFLTDKPYFSDIYDDFIEFVKGSELVIHNAPFDVGFINHEFKLLEDKSGHPIQPIETSCRILDTLKLARDNHPGQKNNLDALCRRYYIDNSNRQLHGALLDSEILADVYLAMTGGQTSLSLDDASGESGSAENIRRLSSNRSALVVQAANDDEVKAHNDYLTLLEKKSGAIPLWNKFNS